MKKNGFSHISRWLWLYMFIVTLSTVGVFILVFVEVFSTLKSHASLSELFSNTSSSESADLLASLKTRIILILSAGVSVVVLLSIVWMRFAERRIHRPIHAIRNAVLRMAQGKLNETVSTDSIDALGQIGGGINELAANLQELLLLIWKQTGQCQALLDYIQTNLDHGDDPAIASQVRQSLQQLRSAVDNLREMANAYVFYDVQLEGDHALGINIMHPKDSSESASI